MSVVITDIEVLDLRFPTSTFLDGSDAMHADPDYSACYVILKTNSASLEGHGLTFTLGKGNEVCVKAAEALAPLIKDVSLEEITENMGVFWRKLTSESQLRWLGPEKGVIHLATAALLNAIWDLWAKTEGKPLWRLVAEMSPEQLVNCIDFRYITDVLTPEEVVDRLRTRQKDKETRIAEMESEGFPAYITSAGWLGYSDEKLQALCLEALDQGWTHFKIKVGRDLNEDIRRCRLMRELIGPENRLMLDANQVWEVPQAIEWMSHLRFCHPYWIEEPTSPDDILGHATIKQVLGDIRVATGEHCQNRVIFKQLFQAEAIDVCQIDSCRLGSVNEVLAVLLMADKFQIPVCPHAGGVGLCQYVQHLSLIDYICISGCLKGRMLEFADHLHEHFLEPLRVEKGRYFPPQLPGYSATMKSTSIRQHRYPEGDVWQEQLHAGAV